MLGQSVAFFSLTKNLLLYKKLLAPGLFLFLLIALGACAPGDQKYAESPAGFWDGLWHGLIMGVTFVISLFNDGVQVYEVANSGGWYNFGFVAGAAIIFGGWRMRAQI